MTGLRRNPPMTVGMAGYAEFIIGGAFARPAG
jgi:hypothetical protein